METTWDYTDIAKSYLERPNYSGAAIDAMLKVSDMNTGKIVCDIEAWKSHANLGRQAGLQFGQVIQTIGEYLVSLARTEIQIPYQTNVWLAQIK